MPARANLDSQPFVSVVIPSYDTAELARGAVASVLAQTLPDFEIVLVDDGSRPEQAAILAALAADPRVRLLRQDRAGPDRARRRGWEEARARDRGLPRRRRSLRAQVPGSLSRAAGRGARARRGLHPLPRGRPARRAAQHPAQAELLRTHLRARGRQEHRQDVHPDGPPLEPARALGSGRAHPVHRRKLRSDPAARVHERVRLRRRGSGRPSTSDPAAFPRTSRAAIWIAARSSRISCVCIPRCRSSSATRFAPRSGSTCSRRG